MCNRDQQQHTRRNSPHLFSSASMCASSIVTETSSARRPSWIILLMAPFAFSILQIEMRSACRHAHNRAARC